MTKADVINLIAAKTGESKESTSTIVESFITVLKDSMADGASVYIRGFGSFTNKKRAEKMARDINKNTTIVIPEHFIPFFKPSPEFKELISKSDKIK